VTGSAKGFAIAISALGSIACTPVEGQAEEGGVQGSAEGAIQGVSTSPVLGSAVGFAKVQVNLGSLVITPVLGVAISGNIVPPITCESYIELAYSIEASMSLKTVINSTLEKP
jgi:hypothetical protein